jgi:hypothetical protein
MPSVEIIGVYPVDGPEPCHLIEALIRDCDGAVDLGGFTQEVPGQRQENWQVPYLECLLDADGTAILADDYAMMTNPAFWRGDVRVAFFFHYLDAARPLRTPFGGVQLPAPSRRPPRLRMVEYEPVD